MKKAPRPETVEEAVALIIEEMDDESKQRVRATPKFDLFRYHDNWGAGIRESFGLSKDNKALLKDTGKTSADAASMVIIQAVWTELRKPKQDRTLEPAPSNDDQTTPTNPVESAQS